VIERAVPDGGHALGNHNAGQTFTPAERIALDAGHAFGNYNVGQSITTIKRRTLDDSHTFGNHNIGQTAAIIECLEPNTGHPLRHHNVSPGAGILCQNAVYDLKVGIRSSGKAREKQRQQQGTQEKKTCSFDVFHDLKTLLFGNLDGIFPGVRAGDSIHPERMGRFDCYWKNIPHSTLKYKDFVEKQCGIRFGMFPQ